jgi:Family of unknown function (DUF6338)
VVPDSFVGLVLFVALLAPGFVFLQRRESRHPARTYSALRETGVVVVTSVVINLVVLAVCLVVSAWLPAPNADRLFDEGTAYIALRHNRFVAWGAVALTLSCLLAYLAAAPPVVHVAFKPKAMLGWPKRAWKARGRPARWMRQHSGVTQHPGSTWTITLYKECPDEARCRVGVDIKGGGYIEGDVVRFSPKLMEDDHRTLTLGGQIRTRRRGARALVTLDAQRVVLAASEIAAMFVWYPKVDAALNDDVGDGD